MHDNGDIHGRTTCVRTLANNIGHNMVVEVGVVEVDDDGDGVLDS